MTRPTAPNAVAHPQRATVRLEITESQAANIGLLHEWQTAYRKKTARATRRARHLESQSKAAAELKNLVEKLLQHAITKEWGQRKLAAAVGIPQTTLRRIRDEQVDSIAWLPRVQAAAHKLTATNSPT